MYKTMLVFNDNCLLEKIRALNVWGDASEFEITAVFDSADRAYRELCRERYDLVICETQLRGMDGAELLRRSKEQRLCRNIALCSEKADFEYARQGIIFGACDYFTAPFCESHFHDAFLRIKDAADKDILTEEYCAEKIVGFFENHDDGIRDYLAQLIKDLYDTSENDAAYSNTLAGISKAAADEIFNRNEWFDLYQSNQDFCGDSGRNGRYFADKLCGLFDEYCELFPPSGSKNIEDVILYILNNPESDLKQKTIASEFYINSSYLSTVFSAQTQLRFVDYLTTVKIKRAGWLLQNTNLKISDIASRLDYKDIGYFSRMFKKQYGITPTEYRIPDDYTYQI